MKNLAKPLTVTAMALAAAAGVSLLVHGGDAETSAVPAVANDASPGNDAGMAASMRFTDSKGNPRNPSAEELLAASEAFEADMARILGKNKGKVNVTKHANGTVSATIALDKLVSLQAVESDDGTLTYMHSGPEGARDAAAAPVADWPEM